MRLHIGKSVRVLVRDVTPDELEREIERYRLLFVDCWAPWCGPCRALAPIMEELAEKYKTNPDVAFLKLNTETHGIFAMQQGINAIPCVLVFYEGKPAQLTEPAPQGRPPRRTDRLIGLRPATEYEKVIKQFLK
jgi:thioredoxin-like negative regulator of GroEL